MQPSKDLTLGEIKGTNESHQYHIRHQFLITITSYIQNLYFVLFIYSDFFFLLDIKFFENINYRFQGDIIFIVYSCFLLEFWFGFNSTITLYWVWIIAFVLYEKNVDLKLLGHLNEESLSVHQVVTMFLNNYKDQDNLVKLLRQWGQFLTLLLCYKIIPRKLHG